MLFSYRSQVTTIADKKKQFTHSSVYHAHALVRPVSFVGLGVSNLHRLTENCYREKNILSVFRAMDKRGKVSEETVVLRLRGVYVE